MTQDKATEYFEYKVLNSASGEKVGAPEIAKIKNVIFKGKNISSERITVGTVKAVILFGAFQHRTSQFAKPAKFPHPLLKEATIADLATLQEQAKLNAPAVRGLVDGILADADKLTLSHSPTAGFVDLLEPRYKEEAELVLKIRGYDVDAKQEFLMTLKGAAIQFNKKNPERTASIWSVFDGEPCYKKLVSITPELKSTEAFSWYSPKFTIERPLNPAALAKVEEMAKLARTKHLAKLKRELEFQLGLKQQAQAQEAKVDFAGEEDEF